MSLRRSSLSMDQFVISPDVQRATGPVCLTCGRSVDSEAIVEGYPGSSTTCKVLVKHHGAEELRAFDMGSVEWDYTDLRSKMRRANWFDPRSFEGTPLGVQAPRYSERDAEDPEPARIHSQAKVST